MVTLNEELVLLSEGVADKVFLERIVTARGNFPKFDFPFPNDKFYGNAAFGNMLHALRGDPTGFAKLKGVLIVGDSGDKPEDAFKNIVDQIRAVGGFGVPTEPLKIGPQTAGHPAVAVMLLPDEKTPGSLESLYVEELNARHDWLEVCVNNFLACGAGKPLTWSAEKIAKAKFASGVAATHEDDPSRAAAWVFRSPPVIDVAAACYESVEDRIRDFCVALGFT